MEQILPSTEADALMDKKRFLRLTKRGDEDLGKEIDAVEAWGGKGLLEFELLVLVTSLQIGSHVQAEAAAEEKAIFEVFEK